MSNRKLGNKKIWEAWFRFTKNHMQQIWHCIIYRDPNWYFWHIVKQTNI